MVARGEGTERVLAVVYRGPGAATLPVELPAEWGVPEGAAWTDVLAPGAPVTTVGGKLGLQVQPWSVRYLRR